MLLPSTTFSNQSNWIYVYNNSNNNNNNNNNIDLNNDNNTELAIKKCSQILSDLTLSLNSIKLITPRITKKSLRDKARKDLLSIAYKQGQLTGKWMLFPDITQVDSVWTIIAQETLVGNLGIGSKVSTNSGSTRFLICIYVNDFTDLLNVQQVNNKLKELGIDEKNQAFKLDLFTHLEINSKNKWGIPPSIFTVNNVDSIEIKNEINSIKV
jgi:hypothetical protein